MSLLTIQNLTLSFAGRTVFQNVGFQVKAGDRTGLIGPNGSGKTSLLKCLAGELTPDSGDVSMPRGKTLSYLAQDIQESLKGGLLASVLAAAPGRSDVEARLKAAEKALDEAVDDDTAAEAGTQVGILHGELSEIETVYPSHEAEVILQGLGFTTEDMERDLGEFSGGWRTRAALAGLLYQKPDVLLMDEPTNHLDIPSVRWLQAFLRDFPGAMILICHDKDFLNQQITSLMSLEPEGLRSYSGDYDFYLAAREEEREILEGQKRNQDQKIKEAKKFIDRFKSKASKARQAQSKIKILEKMELIETHKDYKTMQFRFPPVERAGRHVISGEGLSKSYGDKHLYRNLDVSVERGERVGVIGANGAGKTTLLRILAGDLKADEGEVTLGHRVDMSYYAQHQTEALSPVRTILEEVQAAVPGESMSYVRGVCGAFLFSGDDVDKPTGVLSGGEKARVALARLLVSRGNLLVMDEPTNHLDLQSTEMLVEALADYSGSVLFVSHNQAFLNRLATKIWDVRDGHLQEYPGTLYEYYEFQERQAALQKAKGSKGNSSASSKPKPQAKAKVEEESSGNKKLDRQARAEARKAREAKIAPLKSKVRKIEDRISKLETQEAKLADSLADPNLYSDKEKSVPLLKEHGEVRSKLDELMARWENMTEELEALRLEEG